MASIKTALFSFSETCFIENSCQLEQEKSCAKSLRFERKRGEVPEGFLHAAEQKDCNWYRLWSFPKRPPASLLAGVKRLSGYRQSSLSVPARVCKIQKPHCTTGPMVCTAASLLFLKVLHKGVGVRGGRDL